MRKNLSDFWIAVLFIATFASFAGLTFNSIANVFGPIAAVGIIFIATYFVYRTKRLLDRLLSLRTRDQNIAASKDLIKSAQKDITIVGGDVSWVPDLYDALSEASERNILVTIICRPPAFQKQRDSINQLIEACHAKVIYFIEGAAASVRAIMKDKDFPEVIEFSRARREEHFSFVRWLLRQEQDKPSLVDNEQPRKPEIFFVKQYSAENDEAKKLRDLIRVYEKTGQLASVVKRLDFEILRTTLATTVPYYRESNIHLSHVDCDQIRPLCQYLNTERLDRVRGLMNIFYGENFDYFEPVYLTNVSGKRIVSPPILERVGEQYFLIDGAHRVYIARQQKKTDIFGASCRPTQRRTAL